MDTAQTQSRLAEEIKGFLKKSSPALLEQRGDFTQNSTWRRMRKLGTEVWLDTGSIEQADELWTEELSALTTNNTLLNREVQTGRYDSLIAEACVIFENYPQLSERQKILELAFILNVRHALKLVGKFGAFVSVEEHTDLAHDLDRAVAYAIRFHEICPERFIVKIPFTPAGLLAARKIAAKGIALNHTLGFSARQNYIMARVAKVSYVNVFLGRLNAFVINNDLGNGKYIGEKATLASQAAITNLRDKNISQTRQIGASFRSGVQVADLAGIDVMTLPPKVAKEFLELTSARPQIADKTKEQYCPGLNEETSPEKIRLNTLWDISGNLIKCIDQLEKENLDSFSPDDLIDFFSEHNCSDIFVRWSEAQIKTSFDEGKIPNLKNWENLLSEKTIGLDALMNLAGLNSFIKDQTEMDERIKNILEKARS